MAPAKELADRGHSLGNANSLGVGDDLVSGHVDSRKLPDDLGSKRDIGSTPEKDLRDVLSRGSEWDIRSSAEGQDVRGRLDNRQAERSVVEEERGLDHDGVRENAVKRLRSFTEQLRTAAGAMAERAGRLVAYTKDLARAVYQHNRTEQPLERASHELNKAGDALSRASAAVEMKIEHRKELERERVREYSRGFER